MPVVINGLNYNTKDEVAKDLGINPVTLWRWRRKGAMPQESSARPAISFWDPRRVSSAIREDPFAATVRAAWTPRAGR